MSKDELIAKLEAQIVHLQEQLTSVAKEAVNRPTHIQNNNHQRIINNMLPITDEHLSEQAQFLTIEQGADGYAQYVLDYPLKDRVLCVDFSRRKIKYKNHDGEVVVDPEMTKLSQKIFSAIDDRNTQLIEEYLNELKNKLFSVNSESGNEMSEEDSKTSSQKTLNGD